jgi:O-methyltransferase
MTAGSDHRAKSAVGRTRQLLLRGLRKRGLTLVRVRPEVDDLNVPPDIEDDAVDVIASVTDYTMLSSESLYALWLATRHVVRSEIEGAIVECGVWRGGAMMAVARSLLQIGATDRELFLYDTYEGQPEPSQFDVRADGKTGAELLDAYTAELLKVGPETVRANVQGTGYPGDRIHIVVGKVEDTIPESAPERIALLHLDTDWYESTLHEMRNLLPRVTPGGVLLIDDYAQFEGARRAVEEYLEESGRSLFLTRVDQTARIATVC